ncbi:hypothetical protein PG993_001728 [Apiospora rasikravindrae]|uniref:Uncharacterized protein n=1 Tax=Apiospora rasikravindrae TaxID=990691 RepID=A0ABR1UC77_9PEZI
MSAFTGQGCQWVSSPKEEPKTWDSFPTEPVYDADFVDATVLYKDLLPSSEKPIPQGSEVHVHDDSQESDSNDTGSGQPMEITSGSSDDGGGIIREQEGDISKDPPRPQNAPGLPGHHPLRHGHAIRTPATTSSPIPPLTSHISPAASLSPAIVPQGKTKRKKVEESKRQDQESEPTAGIWTSFSWYAKPACASYRRITAVSSFLASPPAYPFSPALASVTPC